MCQRLADVGFLDASLTRYERNNYSNSYVDRTILLHKISRAFVYLVTAKKNIAESFVTHICRCDKRIEFVRGMIQREFVVKSDPLFKWNCVVVVRYQFFVTISELFHSNFRSVLKVS